MNVVMTEHNGFIEIQGTAEKGTFQQSESDKLLVLAKEDAGVGSKAEKNISDDLINVQETLAHSALFGFVLWISKYWVLVRLFVVVFAPVALLRL